LVEGGGAKSNKGKFDQNRGGNGGGKEEVCFGPVSTIKSKTAKKKS